MFTFQLCGPGAAVKEWQLSAGCYRVGRAAEADIQLEDPDVSCFHCELNVTSNAVIVRDLGSSNGTFVNGQPVREAILQPRQSLQLGSSVMTLQSLLQTPGPAAPVGFPKGGIQEPPSAGPSPVGSPSDWKPLKYPDEGARKRSRKRIRLAAAGMVILVVVVVAVSIALSLNQVKPVRVQDLKAVGSTASAEAGGPLWDDWRFYLRPMERGNWNYFGRIDGRAFKAKFWPMLQDSKLATTPELILVCGAGVVNWAYRDTSLTQAQRDQFYQESLPLLVKASELGNWLAMWQTVWMLSEGLGTPRDLPQAMRWATRAHQLCAQRFGPEHTNTATSLGVLAHQYKLRNEHRTAEPMYLRSLEIREKVLGEENPETLIARADLIRLYLKMGDQAKAEPLQQRALRIRERAMPEHPETQESPEIREAKRSLAATENTFGPDHQNVESAEIRDAQKRLTTQERISGPEHPAVAETLNELAGLYFRLGRLSEAGPLFQRALRIREKALGPEHLDTANSLNNLGGLRLKLRDYVGAAPLLKRALAIHEKTLGLAHPQTAWSLYNLGGLYREVGDYVRAEALFRQALTILENTFGPDSLEILPVLSNLGVLYLSLGEYSNAELLLERALTIRQKTVGPESPDTALSANNLALLHHTMGNHAKAEPLYRQALTIWENALGPAHRDTATALCNLAELYREVGQYGKAELLHRRALHIRETTVGPEHPEIALSLHDLGGLYRERANDVQAQALLEQALMMWEKILGPEHPDLVPTLNNLGTVYQRRGDHVSAERLLRRAVSIQEKAFGPNHPDSAVSLNILASVLIDMEKEQQAAEMARQAERVRIWALGRILDFTTEQQRLVYEIRQIAESYCIFTRLGAAFDSASAILHHKGVVLDSLLEDRLVLTATRNPGDADLINQVRAAKQHLTQLLFEAPRNLPRESQQQREAEKDRLSTDVERLEKTLVRRVAGLGRARRALSVTIEQVQKAIPRDAVLLELLSYSHYLGTNKFEPRYGAIVLASFGEPKWVPLGRAEAVERNMELYQAAVRGNEVQAGPKSEGQRPKSAASAGPDPPIANRQSPIQDQSLSTLLAALYQQLWAPIEAALPRGTRTVIISPDAVLNFLSFATLLAPDDKFLSQKYTLRYVTSGRDLLREKRSTRKGQVFLFGNPDFSRQALAATNNPETPFAMRELERRDLASVHLTALPGTARECELLQDKARQWNWAAKVWIGSEAAEAQLRGVESPYVLHIATHGFFLPDIEIKERSPFEDSWRGIGGMKPMSGGGMTSADVGFRPPIALKNPMHRSGLALAGAQTTFEAWKRGETPDSRNDGIVTADEVGLLKLDGTWLVVLSACDTGIGEIKAGEGVLGLRRGFIQAGAENLLMTLWSVADDETARFMLDFYEAAHRSGDAGGALADVQRDWLVRLRKDRGLERAVRLAGPFILNSAQAP